AIVANLAAQVGQAKGRVVEANVGHERSGRVTARLIYDVPLAEAQGLVEKFKHAGVVRAQTTARNPQAADGKLALARIDVTLANQELIVAHDDGMWPQIRKSLSFSFSALMWSLSFIIIGLCVVLPWGLLGYGGYRVYRRLNPPAPTALPPAA